MEQKEMSSLIWPTNQVIEIQNLRELKKVFPDGYDKNLNWLFVGMSPLYGSKLSLDEIEEVINGESEYSESVNGRYYASVLVVHPRLNVVKYGEILVGAEDIEWLRQVVRSTLEAVSESQERNI